MHSDVIKDDISYLIAALKTLEEELIQPSFHRLVEDIVSRREANLKLIVPEWSNLKTNSIVVKRRQYFSAELSDLVQTIYEGTIERVPGIDAPEIIFEHPPTLQLYGAGRSGNVMKSLAQRLLQLGFDVSITGDNMSKSVRPGDLCIYNSGSWRTLSTTNYAKVAKNLGATVVGITSYPERAVDDCTYMVKISGRESMGELRDYYLETLKGKTSTAVDPMGSMYEFKVSVFGDVTVHYVSDLLKETEDSMRKRHANIE
jgi:6-phospho-3-hexuloisomerase